jgi:hypothetical protein
MRRSGKKFDESTHDGQAAIHMRSVARQRFGFEIAIDHDLRAAAARVYGMNKGATEGLFLERCRLAFRSVKEQLDDLTKGIP